MNPPKEILAIDPGKHMGYARFINGIYDDFGTIHGDEEIWVWIGKQRPNLWVVEDYKIRDESHKGFDHLWQSVFPAQVIGAIKFFAYNTGVEVVLQQPSIKSAAHAMMFGKPYEKKQNKHHLDAI